MKRLQLVLRGNIFPTYMFYLIVCFIIAFLLFRINVRVVWEGEENQYFFYILSFCVNFSITSFAISVWFFENKYEPDDFNFGLLTDDFLKTTFKTFFLSLIAAAGATFLILILGMIVLLIPVILAVLIYVISEINIIWEVTMLSLFLICIYINVTGFTIMLKDEDDNWPDDRVDEEYQYEKYQQNDD